MIDLRSDTITRPSDEMRQAIATAEVGDNVFGDDPTVQKLERAVAEMLGKDAAIYMPSGTMTNQVAVRAHTEPGDEVILDANAHIYYYEAGAPAALAGVMLNLVPGKRGVFTKADIRQTLRPASEWFPKPKLICIENTHNRGGGNIWPFEKITEIAKFAREKKIRMHLDGARLWNASVATGIPEREYAKCFDSVSVCFSKGLGAPIGSALCGTNDFIARARRFRTQFGGGMRQAGLVAAGALYALNNNRERLVEDHQNARKLADTICETAGITINPEQVETNILLLEVSRPAQLVVQKLYEAGVWVTAVGQNRLRAVTNLHISGDDINKAAGIIRDVFGNLA